MKEKKQTISDLLSILSMVRNIGIEPMTISFRGSCSTIELIAHNSSCLFHLIRQLSAKIKLSPINFYVFIITLFLFLYNCF